MKKNLLGITMLALFCTACEKNDNPVKIAQDMLAVKYLDSLKSTHFDVKISYNADNAITHYSIMDYQQQANYSYIAEYENGKMAKTFLTAGPNDEPYLRMEVGYNSADQINRMKDVGAGLDTLIYSLNGELSQILTYYIDEFGGKTVIRQRDYTWNNGNIVKELGIDIYPNGRDSLITLYTYDDKINPRARIAGLFCLLEYYNPEDISANNILTSEDNSQFIRKTENTYTYDADNYPATAKSITTAIYDPSDPYIDSTNTRFVYR
ncbi:hypothetical protein SAMN05518672_107138 [Chitinophaga sp. CF118]|uniref:hypothetical protein n=1 Tax=Chitinophaga sp. CF118 TaxID=1884367 RepID=UPI0008F25771|nr:hypothetical protein [Chitinophaga sp. CF118]SFE53802.1 hypothetical protein SAMN05518672_107138 [Chitinophaga sp. CF118]